jgi:hypothetical protein
MWTGLPDTAAITSRAVNQRLLVVRDTGHW